MNGATERSSLPADGQISVFLLGLPHINVGGEYVKLKRRKARALVYYLSAHRRPVHRREIISVFWADLDETVAFQNLSTYVHNIKKEIPGLLISENDWIAISDQVFVDVRLLDTVEPQEPGWPSTIWNAIKNNNITFLEGFTLDDSPDFDNWVTVQRTYYTKKVINYLEQQSELLARQGNLRQALSLLQQAMVFAPLKESLYENAMRLQALMGNRAEAIYTYERIKTLLNDEIGLPPMPGIQSLYDDIIMDRLDVIYPAAARSSGLPADSPALNEPDTRGIAASVAMESEQEYLSFLRQSEEKLGLFLLTGAPGMGKTSILMHYLSGLSCPYVLVAAEPTGSNISFYLFSQLLKQLFPQPFWREVQASALESLSILYREQLQLLMPETDLGIERFVSSEPNLRYLLPAITELFRLISYETPLVCAIDDLNYADKDSFVLLEHLVVADIPGISFVCTAGRTNTEAVEWLTQALLRKNRLVKKRMTRFDMRTVRTIVGTLCPGGADDLSVWLYHHSDGHPGYLFQLLHFVCDKGWIRDNTFHPAYVPAPDELFDFVSQCSADMYYELSAEEREVIEILALQDGNVDIHVLSNTMGMPLENLCILLQDLSQTDIVSLVEQDGVTYSYSVLRDIVLFFMTSVQKTMLHTKLAQAMEGAKTSKTAIHNVYIAMHYSKSFFPDRCCTYALQVARHYVNLRSYEKALEFFEMARCYQNGMPLLDTLYHIADIQFLMGDTSKSYQVFSEGSDIAYKLGEAILSKFFLLQAYMVRNMWFDSTLWGPIPDYVLSYDPEIEKTIESVESGLFNREDLFDFYCRLLILSALFYENIGKLKQAESCYKELLEKEKTHGGNVIRRFSSFAYYRLVLYEIKNHASTAQKDLYEGIRSMIQWDMLDVQPFMRALESYFSAESGDILFAETCLKESRMLAGQIDNPYAYPATDLVQAYLLLKRGNRRDAFEILWQVYLWGKEQNPNNFWIRSGVLLLTYGDSDHADQIRSDLGSLPHVIRWEGVDIPRAAEARERAPVEERSIERNS